MKVKFCTALVRLALFIAFAILIRASVFAASVNPHPLSPHSSHSKSRHVTESQHARRRMHALAHSRAPLSKSRSATYRRHHYYERFYTSSFAKSDLTEGDVTAGEDPTVRAAAIDALGNMNGTVVAIEPTSGRILAMVNQKLALSSGAQPCSTIKLSVALAAAQRRADRSRDRSSHSRRRTRLNLTEALAHSNNAYFEALGRKLGFEKVSYYAHQFGLGEYAGYHVAGEQLGTYPAAEIPTKLGGVGKMCSFGEGISMTPLQLGAMVAAISNGGTLYYLQHPTIARRSRRLPAHDQAPSRHRQCYSRTFRRHGWRRHLRNRSQPAPQLQRRIDSRQNRHLLARRHALRMVRLLRQHRHWPHCDGGVPARQAVPRSGPKPQKLPVACIAISTTIISS